MLIFLIQGIFHIFLVFKIGSQPRTTLPPPKKKKTVFCEPFVPKDANGCCVKEDILSWLSF